MSSNVRPFDASRLEREALETGPYHERAAAEAPSLQRIGPAEDRTGAGREITLNDRQRERERILPAGARGPAGHAYKLLRTQVISRLRRLRANSLAVLSSGSGEGKTLTALNLAIAIAADFGHTALLVDLDLRNPCVHRRLGFDPETGIDDCLQQGRALNEAMIKVRGYERLTIIPARSPVEQSSELLLSQRMGDLVGELRSRYSNRIVLFDVPPVLASDDALAFSRHVEAGLLVVSEGHTSRESIQRSLALLDRLTIVGTVLNQSRESQAQRYAE